MGLPPSSVSTSPSSRGSKVAIASLSWRLIASHVSVQLVGQKSWTTAVFAGVEETRVLPHWSHLPTDSHCSLLSLRTPLRVSSSLALEAQPGYDTTSQDTLLSHGQWWDTLLSHGQWRDTLLSHGQWRDTLLSHGQWRDILLSHGLPLAPSLSPQGCL